MRALLRHRRACAASALLAALPLGPGAAFAQAATTQPVEIVFSLSAGEQPIDCHSAPVTLGRGAGTPVRLRDARLYLHDLALVRADGQAVAVRPPPSAWQTLGVVLIDFESGDGSCSGGSPATNTRLQGEVPAGDYTGLRFRVGVPLHGVDAQGRDVVLNHGNPDRSEPPLDSHAMAWSWQGGRKFMKVEVAPEGGVHRAQDVVRVWTLHLGSTACKGNPVAGEGVSCANANRFDVALAPFDASRQRVDLDLAALYAGSDLAADAGGASGCMSAPDDPECAPLFARLGLALRPADAPMLQPQSVFRTRSR